MLTVDDFFQNTISLVGLQLFSRLLTFLLNQSLLSYVSPSLFGVVYVQYELLTSSILFLSRDCIRTVLQRFKVLHIKQINMLFLPILFGACLWSLFFLLSFFYWKNQKNFVVFHLYGLSAFVLLLSEPFYNYNLNRNNVSSRVRIESTAMILKCALTFILVSYLGMEIMAFAYGELLYSLTVFIGYFCLIDIKLITPKIPEGFDNESLLLLFSLQKQMVVKFVLSEGDKMILTFFSDNFDQGIFALANNYGSLIVRILFLPVEESFRVIFAKVDIKTSISYFQIILKLYIYLSMLIMVFGSFFSSIFLEIIAGPIWSNSDAPDALRLYCFLIPALAINGITEAFGNFSND
jgi:hypothetical protein